MSDVTRRLRIRSAAAIITLAGLVFAAPPAIAQTGEDPASPENAVPTERQAVYVKLMSGAYAELERGLDAHLDDYVAGKISEKDLASRFAVFSRVHSVESRFDDWVKAYPASYAARLARGVNGIAEAWRLRGAKFSDQTTDEQFRQLGRRMKQAAGDLQASLKLHPKPVTSYGHLITVSMALGQGAERGMLDAALRLDPKAHSPRRNYLYSLAPKWGGSVASMTQFIDECKRSPLGADEKTDLELFYFTELAGHARTMRDFKMSSELYLKAYRLKENPYYLLWSGSTARDGGFADLALARYDELVKAAPKYSHGFSQRGYLYESSYASPEKALKDYLVAADLGNSWAQNRVGFWYMSGKYVEKDLDKAESYLRKAAAQNNSRAIGNLKILQSLRAQGDGKR